jgi:hypothetical protein
MGGGDSGSSSRKGCAGRTMDIQLLEIARVCDNFKFVFLKISKKRWKAASGDCGGTHSPSSCVSFHVLTHNMILQTLPRGGVAKIKSATRSQPSPSGSDKQREF